MRSKPQQFYSQFSLKISPYSHHQAISNDAFSAKKIVDDASRILKGLGQYFKDHHHKVKLQFEAASAALCKYFVYADLDMAPMSSAELFDQRTMYYLDSFGFVLAKGGNHGFENGFQILNGHHAQLMRSHRQVIIDLNLQMAAERQTRLFEQQVYDSYPAMAMHFLEADGRCGKLNEEKMGDRSLGLARYRSDRCRCF